MVLDTTSGAALIPAQAEKLHRDKVGCKPGGKCTPAYHTEQAKRRLGLK